MIKDLTIIKEENVSPTVSWGKKGGREGWDD